MKKVWFATAAVGAALLTGCTGGGGGQLVSLRLPGLFSKSASAAASGWKFVERPQREYLRLEHLGHHHLPVAPH